MTLKGGKKVKKKSLNKKTVKKNYKKSQKHSNKGKKYSIKKKRKMKGGMDRPRRNIDPNYNPHSFADLQYEEKVEAEKRAQERRRQENTQRRTNYSNNGPSFIERSERARYDYLQNQLKKPKNFNPEHYQRVPVNYKNGPDPRPPGAMEAPPGYVPNTLIGRELYKNSNYGNMTAGMDLYEAVGIATGQEQAPWSTLPLPTQYKYEETARLLLRLSQQI